MKRQLQCLKQGFDKLLPHVMISVFSPDELEMILCGQSTIDLAFMRRRTSYIGYSSESSVVVWLWEILESLSHVRVIYHILENNALSKECKLCEENCTHTHKKAKVSI